MSLQKPSLVQVVKKQYYFKLKAYSQVFFSLIFIQILAILFSFNGIGMSGGGSESIGMNVHYYSADMVIIFTFIWAFITAIIITTKAYKNDEFSFVTNRLSSNVANVFFLLTTSFVGSVTAMLSAYSIKVIMYYFIGQTYVNDPSKMAAWAEFILGIFSTSLYVFLFSVLGYFVGTFVQVHKAFVVLLPAAFIGLLIIGQRASILGKVFKFIFMESSFLLFIIKMSILAFALISCSFFISNRMEVKQ